VAQYGTAVLGKPPAHGFDLAVYIVPPALVVAGILTLSLVLPRWRRRRQAPTPAQAPTIAAEDARRLEADLARFDG
jgi:cytochrome c-type biogenesis protein CcmH/NrfF